MIQMPDKMPDKIIITENYADKAFEDSVLKLLSNNKGRGIDRNKILRWGSRYPYDNFIVSEKIPALLLSPKDFEFNSVTVNDYAVGQSIVPHIDEGNNDIYVISLLCDEDIKFRLEDREISFLLPRYSLCCFGDELRFEWEHSVLCKERRVSVVFRNCIRNSYIISIYIWLILI